MQGSNSLNILDCSVCYERFDLKTKKPVILPCAHTICQTCAKKLYSQGQVKCPFDKKVMYIQSMSDLKINFQVTSYITPNETPINLCRFHVKEKISLYCSDCKQFICQYCLIESHLKHSIKASTDALKELNAPLNKKAELVLQKIIDKKSKLQDKIGKIDQLSEIIKLAKEVDAENQKLKKDTVEQIADLEKNSNALSHLIFEVNKSQYNIQDVNKLKKYVFYIQPQLSPVEFEEIQFYMIY